MRVRNGPPREIQQALELLEQAEVKLMIALYRWRLQPSHKQEDIDRLAEVVKKIVALKAEVH